MLTRKETTLWPFDTSVWENFIAIRSKPPTNENILLRFQQIHQETQVKTSQQSRKKDAAKKTIAELLSWRVKTGHICQLENGLAKKLLNLANEHKLLSQHQYSKQKKGINSNTL